MGGWPVGFYKEWRSWIRDHWSTNPSSGREEDYQSSALPLGHARLPPSTTCDVIDLNVTRYSWYAFSTARVDPRTANNPGPQTISKLKTGLKFNLVRWFSAPYVVNLFSFVYTDRQTDRQPAFRHSSYSGGLCRHREQKERVIAGHIIDNLLRVYVCTKSVFYWPRNMISENTLA